MPGRAFCCRCCQIKATPSNSTEDVAFGPYLVPAVHLGAPCEPYKMNNACCASCICLKSHKW
nr:MAG TPA: SFI toxin family [Caudoviricetes sp.]